MGFTPGPQSKVVKGSLYLSLNKMLVVKDPLGCHFCVYLHLEQEEPCQWVGRILKWLL